MANAYQLTRYWQQWGDKLKPLVTKKGAKLHFPPRLVQKSKSKNSETYEPAHPVCFYNAPEKASSSRLRANHRYVFFVHGDLEVANDPSGLCVNHHCSMTIFRQEEVGPRAVRLRLVDALHFDVDVVDPDTGEHTGFHPIFHVQRGTGLSDERCRQTLSEAMSVSETAIEVDQSNRAVLGTSYIRIPTPQLDVFSVLTLVAADIFCNPGDATSDQKHDVAVADGDKKKLAVNRSNVKEQFVGILDLLRHENFAREGHYLSVLRQRSENAKHLSSALWYPECV